MPAPWITSRRLVACRLRRIKQLEGNFKEVLRETAISQFTRVFCKKDEVSPKVSVAKRRNCETRNCIRTHDVYLAINLFLFSIAGLVDMRVESPLLRVENSRQQRSRVCDNVGSSEIGLLGPVEPLAKAGL